MTDAEQLQLALNRLRRYGWIQKQSKSEHGMCIMGAICRTNGLVSWEVYFRLLNEVRETLDEQYPGWVPEKYIDISWPQLWIWNDVPSRTFEEVERVLEKTILRLEEQGA